MANSTPLSSLLKIVAPLALAAFFSNGACAQNGDNNKPWRLLCETNSCRMYSSAYASNGTVISSISLKNANESDLFGVLTLPHGLHIPSGVTVEIDEKVSLQPNLIDCSKSYCRAMFGVSSQIIAALIDGKELRVNIVDSGTHKLVSIIYSLEGFNHSYENFLQQINSTSTIQLRPSISG